MDAVHHFYAEHAKKYGLEEAVLLYDIIYWVAHNTVNGVNYHDGRYWTFNTAAAFADLHPYWKDEKNGRTDKIQRIINSLVKQGAIIKGNYNDTAYNRTSWYALSDELAESITEMLGIEYAKMRNGRCENADSMKDNIPDIKNTDIKQADNAHTRVAKNISNRFSFRDALIVAGASEPCVDKLMEIRKRKRLNNSEHASRQLIAAITTICNTRGVTVDDVLRFMDTQDWGAIRPDWGGVEHIRSSVPRGGKMLSFEELMNRDRNRYASQ